MGEFICLYSSDYRNLYLDDIFRVLALPEKYTIKFRYQKKYIHPQILEKGVESLINREGMVFFTQGTKPMPEGKKVR